MANDDDEYETTMLQRAEGSELRLYVLLRLNRWVLSGAILLVVFGALVAMSALGLGPFRDIVQDADAIQNVFSSMFSPIITGVTLVATIGQLVLSQELGAVGDQRERMQESMEFRRDVEGESEMVDVSPPEPAAFLRELVAATEDCAEHLRDAVEDERDEVLKESVNEYVDNLDQNAEAVREKIENAQFGTFAVIWAALDFNYSWKIFQARRIRDEYEGSLSEEANEAMDDTIEMLKLYGPAREHFKTLYFQWELINLARALLYASVPALIVTAGMLMYVDGSSVPGTTVGVDNLVWLTSGAFAVTLVPFVVLIAFIFRIATVAQRTLAMGPFILRESSRDAESDV